MNEPGKYIITIVEGSTYHFAERNCDIWHIIKKSHIEEEEKEFGQMWGPGSVGGICIEAFSKIFFTPDLNKSYDITVKKVA